MRGWRGGVRAAPPRRGSQTEPKQHVTLLLSKKRRRIGRVQQPSEAPLPKGWRNLPAAQLRALAEDLLGITVKTKREAIAALEKGI